MAIQYVSVKFQPWDRKSYTYTWDDSVSKLAHGDRVHVVTKDGRVEVEVESVDLPKPDYDCKPIAGRVE